MSHREPVIPRGDDPLTARQRIELTVEVLTTYWKARRTIRDDDLPGAMAELRRGFDETCTPSVTDPELHGAASRLGYIVSNILRLLPTDSRCLMRSLVLTRLLARRDIPSTLIIGVSAAPEFKAHAWVEYAGLPLLPSYGPMFSRLVEL
jgi:hypothetical protein